ncbi:hypothetical protein cypCar_00046815, partial [Cyprinus carpio]
LNYDVKIVLKPSPSSGALKDPHPELSDQEFFWGADQYDFSIMLRAGDLQCYWHFAHFGERFYLNFMVQLVTGVALDRHLSVTVNAPSGLIVGTVDDASGQIAFSVQETGFYQMCFSNFHNRFGSMQVFLNFGVYYEGQKDIEKQKEEEKKKKEEDMKQINSTLSFIECFFCPVVPYGSSLLSQIPPPPAGSGDRSLEDHISVSLFLMLANTTSYPEDVLCTFYDASLNTACRAPSSEDGPREGFATFMQWTVPTICVVRASWDCHPPVSPWLEYPLTLPPASKLCTPPRPVDPSAPPWLLAHSSTPWPISPLAPPGSLVPPALPWSGVDHPAPWDSTPPTAPCPFVSPDPSGSFITLAPPQSSVTLAPPQPSGSPPLPRSPAPSAPPWPSGSSTSPWLIGSPSPPRATPPLAQQQSVGPLESSALLPPWLLPQSAPPGVAIMAVAWIQLDSSCSKSLLSPPWLIPPLSPPRASFQVPTRVFAPHESNSRLQRFVFHMWRHYNYERMRRGADFYLLQSNSTYVNSWSAVQSLVIITAGYLQLYCLKRLFNTKPAEGDKPRC